MAYGEPNWIERRYVCPGPNQQQIAKLYSLKQTPRGSVVVLGDHIVSDYEMPTPHAQQLADWLNDRKKHAC
jgi:hypothetical protein